MTNILATVIVCLVTNVTWTDNSQTTPYLLNSNDCDANIVPGSQPAMIDTTGHIVLDTWDGWGVQGHTTEATEKTKTTVIQRIHKITFKWRGKSWNGQDVKEVSRKVQTYKKKEEWEEVK